MKYWLITMMILFSVNIFALTISDEKLKQRKQQAIEIVSSDEGFLEEYLDFLNRFAINYFYKLSFVLSENVAIQTIEIIDDNDAYVFMMERIENKNGVKEVIEYKVKLFLNNEYNLDEIIIIEED